jgi:hypothetical protein
MKTAKKKASASTSTAIGRILAWPGIALLSLALACAVAIAFPVNFKQDKNAQGNNVEPTKRFVGTWRGKPHNMPRDMPPNTDIDAVLIFKIEDGRLKGTVRALGIRRRNEEAPQVIRDEYVPLPELNVEGKTLTWKENWTLPDHEKLSQVTLISDDEILFETVGAERSSGRPTLLKPISYKLKREK